MNSLLPFSSELFGDMTGTAEMRAVWTDENLLAQWIVVERAIIEAQAELGMIPSGSASEIIVCLDSGRLTVADVACHRRRVNHLMVAFLDAFREVCGPAAEHFHVGPTTQDILDTGLTLQMREANGIIRAQALELEELLCERALEFRAVPVMGRSHARHAVPVTFGFQLANWAWEIHEHIERGVESEKRWLIGGTHAGTGAHSSYVELAGESAALELERRVRERLSLRDTPINPHPRTGRFSEVLGQLAETTTSLARFGLNIRFWQSSEVAEVYEPYSDEQHSSSTMPNKRNPERSEQLDGLARLVRSLASAMQGVTVLDDRDASRIPVEFTAIPQCYLLTSRAIHDFTAVVRGLRISPDRMRFNLDHPNELGTVAAERLMIALYKKTGEKHAVHAELHRLCDRSRAENRSLRELVEQVTAWKEVMSREDWDHLFDLSTYTGTATAQTERTVEKIRQLRRMNSLEPALLS